MFVPAALRELLRQLAGLQDSDLDRDAGDEAMATRLDQLVRRQLGDVQLFGTSVVPRTVNAGVCMSSVAIPSSPE